MSEDRESGSPTGSASEYRTDTWAWLERYWWVPLVSGIVLAIFGVVILANVVTTSNVLAVLLGLYLIVDGISSLVTARRTQRHWAAYLLGAVMVIGGIVAVAWPSATLRVLGIVFGATLVAGGLLWLLAWSLDPERRVGWAFWLGAASLTVGILALAWPQVTVYVLVVLIGIRALASGITQIGVAFELHHHAPLHGTH